MTTYRIRVWVSDSSGVRSLDVDTFDAANGLGYAELVSGGCTRSSTTVSVCTRNLRLDPVELAGYSTGSADIMAGRWTLYADARANDGDYRIVDDLIRFPVLRQTRPTISPANPQTVARAAPSGSPGAWCTPTGSTSAGPRSEGSACSCGSSVPFDVVLDGEDRDDVDARARVGHGVGERGWEDRWKFLGNSGNAVGGSTETTVTLK